MNSKGNSHKTQIIIAIIGLIGTLAGALIANWEKLFPPQDDQSRKEVMREESRAAQDEYMPVDPIVSASPQHFMGTYAGISTEGINQYQTKISFSRNGNNVTGTYSQAGLTGSFNGTVYGTTLYYSWNNSLGQSGRGKSIATGNKVSGTWGYWNSIDNGGQLNATLQ